MSTLANQLVKQEREEIARAIRLLLATPLITAHNDSDALDLVRRHRNTLAKWFDYNCGWQLVVEPRLGYARLVKVRAGGDPSRPARRRRSSRAAFDRRRYVLLCVTAAELMAAPVTTIGLLAARVTQACAADEALTEFDSTRRSERQAFVDVLKLLEHYGVVDAMDGSTEGFVDDASAKVLYHVDVTLLMRLLATPVAPSRVDAGVSAADFADHFDEALAKLTVERRYGSRPDPADDGGGDKPSNVQHNLWLRHSVLRRLLDDPVVYRDELTPAQLGYLSSLTGRQIMRQACAQAGFELEERTEGFLLVDPDAIATDGKFPDDASHAKVAALHLLDAMVRAPGGLTPEQLEVMAGQMLRRKPSWARSYQSDGGPARLASDAVAVLESFGLAQISDGGVSDGQINDGMAAALVSARPAAARYTVQAHLEE